MGPSPVKLCIYTNFGSVDSRVYLTKVSFFAQARIWQKQFPCDIYSKFVWVGGSNMNNSTLSDEQSNNFMG